MDSIGIYVLFVVFIVINIFAFLVVGYDKRKSVTGQREDRIPEGVMFFFGAIFGAAGIFAGMQLFRHKTRTWYFQLGIPLLIIQNISLTYMLLQTV